MDSFTPWQLYPRYRNSVLTERSAGLDFCRLKIIWAVWGFELLIAYPVVRSLYGLCYSSPVCVYVHIGYIANICTYSVCTYRLHSQYMYLQCMNRIRILSDNCRLLLSAASTPRVWPVGLVGHVTLIYRPKRSGKR